MKFMQKTLKKVTKNQCKLRVVAVISILVITLASLTACAKKDNKYYKEYFVRYENATKLVAIDYGERFFLTEYRSALGFINEEIYNSYIKGEYDEGKIKVYHPYSQGRSVTVDASAIVTINEHTYESFYNEYPPSVYADEKDSN